jgi:hypothetical protein
MMHDRILEDSLYRLIRESFAANLATKDPARAEAMVESIPDPTTKVSALTRVARALPASASGRKQALLERATMLLRDRLQRANDLVRLQLVSAIAGQRLDIGDHERARLVLQRPGRKGRCRCIRGDRSSDPGDRSAAGIGTGLRTGLCRWGRPLMYPSNPAAVILPVVERIGPKRLAEVFWQAVALHPR